MEWLRWFLLAILIAFIVVVWLDLTVTKFHIIMTIPYLFGHKRPLLLEKSSDLYSRKAKIDLLLKKGDLSSEEQDKLRALKAKLEEEHEQIRKELEEIELKEAQKFLRKLK